MSLVLNDKQRKVVDALLAVADGDVALLEHALRRRGRWPTYRDPTLTEVVADLVAARPLEETPQQEGAQK